MSNRNDRCDRATPAPAVPHRRAVRRGGARRVHNGRHDRRVVAPFPGSVLSAAPLHLCRASHCMATYTVTISNPTDGDANVQDCAVSPPVPGLDRLPIMGIAGLSVPAGESRKTTARFLLPISPRRVEALVGRNLECTGIDWHGHAPI